MMVDRAGMRRWPLSLNRLSRLLSRVFVYSMAIAASCVYMGPFLWTVSSSLKDVSELHTFPPRLLPSVPQWSNYARIFGEVPMFRWIGNSILVTALSVIGTVLSASLVAYSFARFRYPGRDVLFTVVISTMLLPVEVTIIPTYLLFHYIRWLDTLKPLIVPSWLGGGPFAIFLLRQFFMTIPLDLDEAAKLDGASHFTIYWRLLLPLSRPALATLAVISFIGHWNAFLGPLIFLNSPEKYTLAIGLRYFQTLTDLITEPTEHLLMGASVIMSFAPIVLFFTAQRYFVRGIVTSGIKG